MGTEEANFVHDPAYRDSFQFHTLVFVPHMSALSQVWGRVGGGRGKAGIYFDWCIMKSQAFVLDSRVFQCEHTSIRVQTSVFVIKSRVFHGAFVVFVMNPQVFKCKLPQFVINKYPVLVDVYLVNKPKFYSLVNKYLVNKLKISQLPSKLRFSANCSFSENLSGSGIILRFTSKPERGLFIL